jgi:hypothetical protein
MDKSASDTTKEEALSIFLRSAFAAWAGKKNG